MSAKACYAKYKELVAKAKKEKKKGGAKDKRRGGDRGSDRSVRPSPDGSAASTTVPSTVHR